MKKIRFILAKAGVLSRKGNIYTEESLKAFGKEIINLEIKQGVNVVGHILTAEIIDGVLWVEATINNLDCLKSLGVIKEVKC